MTVPAGGRDPTGRFSDRVAFYSRSRPTYPDASIDVVVENHGLRPGDVIADIGSGTGKLAELFLRRGHRVVGVEPNEPMRRGAEEILASHEAFHSVDGRAEETTLVVLRYITRLYAGCIGAGDQAQEVKNE